ncbi:hypothetical protein ACIGEZ_04810 [Streptomyces sp. NPDC085481]|uniref:RCC1 domain-containing protein n=1 Tax=Streptomyces sp. NPDC085481 TaxID=3365727 RepID=UPI0037D225B6
MRASLLSPGRTARRSAAAIGLAALLWGGLAPVTAQAAAGPAPDGRTAGARPADARATEPGTGLAWGTNGNGELGTGTTVVRSTTPAGICGGAPCPTPFDDVIAVDGGSGHGIALRADGSVWTWGANFNGQLGNGSFTFSTTPVQVCAVGETAPCDDFLTDVTAIAAGASFNLALRANGTVIAWGGNFSGQLGDGTTTSTNVPVASSGLGNVVALAAGDAHSLALFANGQVASWGANLSGQLGNGGNIDSSFPGLTAVSNIRALAGGGSHSMALRADGTVLTWGSNTAGQLGNGGNTNSNIPIQVGGLSGVTSIAAGANHSLAVPADGTARAWGSNSNGQLGNGTLTNSSVPVQVCAPGTTNPCASFLTGVTNVSGGFSHSVALRSDGSVRAWGSNFSGQLGDGTITESTVPVRVCAPGDTAPCTRNLDGVGALGTGFSATYVTTKPSADLAVSLKASPNPVAANANLTYTIAVTNHGPSAAENVIFDDTLPAEGEFVTVQPSQGTCKVPLTGTTDTVTCNLGTLSANTSRTATIVVTVKANPGSTVTNTAQVSSTTPDPRPVNNSATVRSRVN